MVNVREVATRLPARSARTVPNPLGGRSSADDVIEANCLMRGDAAVLRDALAGDGIDVGQIETAAAVAERAEKTSLRQSVFTPGWLITGATNGPGARLACRGT